MVNEDTFGHDPAVRQMRRIFARTELVQQEFFERLDIKPHDERLRRIREVALSLFEKTCVQAANRGIARDEEEIAAIYILCLARACEARGIYVPRELLPAHEKISAFVKEVLK
jgi:hypothetical protein